ncbi:MAG: hypothetical protein IJY79_01130, partial [Clostridia bacterium]|nr:hypothetical protein [Clostridia bacterium]
MAKVFKNSKSVLAFVLAFAVLAVSLFTGVVINSDAESDGYQVLPIADNEINAVSYSGKVTTVELLDPTQANSESNPYIITDPGQIFALSRDELKCGDVVVGQNHEYFKVEDGIDAFYMNGGETVANLPSAAEVKTYFEANGGSKWWSNSNSTFNGSFDGNGVIIYGLYSDGTSAGLFPYSSANSTTAAPQTIKNITVKNSYLTGSSAAGAIIGNFRGTAGSTIFENCASINNYINSTSTSNMTGGALFGKGYGMVKVNNCLAYDNIVENSYVTTYNKNLLIGYSGGSTYITNVIALGVTPWDLTAPWSRNHIDTGNFVNIFTDQDIQPLLDFATTQNTEANAIKYNINGNIEPADMLGANAAAKTAELTAANKAVRDANGWPFPGADLDWENTWICGANGEYPELRVFHDIDIIDNGDGTHSEACADCSLAGAASAHTYDKEAADGKCTVCGAGCTHGMGDSNYGAYGAFEFSETVAGDCTTAPKGNMICSLCGFT